MTGDNTYEVEHTEEWLEQLKLWKEQRESVAQDCKPHDLDSYLDQHPMSELKEDE
jgi:hypothetical protein